VLRSLARGGWDQRLDAFVASAWDRDAAGDVEDEGYGYELEVTNDGTVRFVASDVIGSAQRSDAAPVYWEIAEQGVAQRLTYLLGIAGRLLDAAGYVGPVDVGVLITQLQGAVGRTMNERRLVHRQPPVLPDEYLRETRAPSGLLLSDPKSVAKQLTDPLFVVLSDGGYAPEVGPFPLTSANLRRNDRDQRAAGASRVHAVRRSRWTWERRRTSMLGM
jgi:hypothetical protein